MKNSLLLILSSLIVVACSKENSDTVNTQQPAGQPVTGLSSVPVSQADLDPTLIVKGERLYQQNCAVCHGRRAEGDPHWRKRKPDGKLLPPPLDGTGHTWHHSKTLLASIITKGTASQGGDMPAWGDKLSIQEIDAILTWIQSRWNKDIYKNWLEINSR